MTAIPIPKLDEVANLLLLAEEANVDLGRLARYLIGRDPLTGPMLAELQDLARDAEIEIGSFHWAFSALQLNEQVDLLLSADGRTWKRAPDLLDPDRDRGIDYTGLITVLGSRIARFRGNKTRMKQVRHRLLRESSK